MIIWNFSYFIHRWHTWSLVLEELEAATSASSDAVAVAAAGQPRDRDGRWGWVEVTTADDSDWMIGQRDDSDWSAAPASEWQLYKKRKTVR